MRERLARITDLFVEGTELVLADADDTGKPVVIWIKKLNPFEAQEAQLDGQAARSEKLLALRDPEAREMKIARITVEKDWSDEDLVNALVNAKLAEMYQLARDDVESDEEWSKHLVYLRRMAALQLDDPSVSDDERQLYQKTQADYLAAIQAKLRERQDEYRDELVTQHSQEEREELYYDMVRERQGFEAYGRQRRISEIWYAARDCQATTKKADGTWDHDSCTHEQLFDRSEIPRLGAELLTVLTKVIDELTMPVQEAGNSAAPTSSSGSLEQSSAPEETSPASSPEETSDVAPMS